MAVSDLKKRTKFLLTLALGFTIGLIVGLPLIIIGAINLSNGTIYAVCLGAGIMCVGGGFFGCPLCWVMYAEKRGYLRLVEIVTSRDVSTIEMLSGELAKPQGDIMNDLTTCLQKQWITGYAIRGDRIVNIEAVDPYKMKHHVRCAFCNATFEFVGVSGKCPYCGNWVEDKN